MARAKGVPLSPEHRARIAAANTGKRHSPETRAKLSAIQLGCKRQPMPAHVKAILRAANAGRIVSAESRERMRVAALARAGRGEMPWQGKKRPPFSQEWKDKIGAAARGRPGFYAGKKRGPYPPEWCANISRGQKGRKLSQAQIEKLRRLKPRHKKRVPYGDHVFRSTYELRVARALDALGVPWQYEPRRFDLKDFSYTPDFYLPEDGCFWEVKGWFGPRDQQKVAAFREQVPDVPLVLFNKHCMLDLESRVFARGV